MLERLLRSLVTGLAILVVSAAAAGAQKAPKQVIFVDFVVLNEGQGLKDRDAYDIKALPIAARHGIKRFASLDIKHVVRTPGLKPQRLDLWLLPSPQALNAWAADPEYKALIAQRDEVHDMKALTLYLAVPARPMTEFGKHHYLIEIQKTGSGFSRELFANYEKKSDQIAAPYAIRRVAVLNMAKKLLGIGPAGQRLNIWHLPNEQNFSAWGKNKEFKALGPVRQQLFDLPQYLMLIAQGR
ncbi:MAG: hypothetical protein QF893_15735 [Alphaproteobacteria bacterium]|jgi:uncharacterized protein (DUF1330 family)|nr:hypothetical protein [Alphaproteobacteria bacterium]